MVFRKQKAILESVLRIEALFRDMNVTTTAVVEGNNQAKETYEAMRRQINLANQPLSRPRERR